MILEFVKTAKLWTVWNCHRSVIYNLFIFVVCCLFILIALRWAKDAQDFVRKHRAALESPYVSAHLHLWIDLIWGYKQRGKAAEDANNLFYHLTYEGAVKLDEMEDQILQRAMKEQIANFGQTPIQLFHKPHAERDPPKEITPYSWRIGNKYQNIPFLHEVKINKCTPIQQILLLDSIKSKDYNYDIFVTISISGCPLGHTLFLENIQNSNNNKSKVKPKIPSAIRDLYTYRTPPSKYSMPSFVLFENSHLSKYHPSSLTKATFSCIAYNENIVYVGNNWDSSLRVYRLEYSTSTNIQNDHYSKKHKKPHLGQIKCRLISHKSRISCIHSDAIHLASGSDDCTVVIWQLHNGKKSKNMYFAFDLLLNANDNQKTDENASSSSISNGLILNSKCVLRGHQSPIIAVALNSELDTCVSCSSQGLILVHTVSKGEYRHSLYLSGDVCGRGAVLSNLQFEHIPDGGRPLPKKPLQKHPDVLNNPFDDTSSYQNDNNSSSDMELDEEEDAPSLCVEYFCKCCFLFRFDFFSLLVFYSSNNQIGGNDALLVKC